MMCQAALPLDILSPLAFHSVLCVRFRLLFPTSAASSDLSRLMSDCTAGSPTFVLDCIDDVNTKAELLGFCQSRGLKVVASLGAGGKVSGRPDIRH